MGVHPAAGRERGSRPCRSPFPSVLSVSSVVSELPDLGSWVQSANWFGEFFQDCSRRRGEPEVVQCVASGCDKGGGKERSARFMARGTRPKEPLSGNGKPHAPKHTTYSGRARVDHTSGSGLRAVFVVCCLRLQRWGSRVAFGTGVRTAPKNKKCCQPNRSAGADQAR